jgi:hypothetical protein
MRGRGIFADNPKGILKGEPSRSSKRAGVLRICSMKCLKLRVGLSRRK